MTTVYLAWSPSAHTTLANHCDDRAVDVLVAYPVLKQWEKLRGDYNVNRWVMDSGAFSVWNSGKTIRLDDYNAACKDVDASEIFGLDVIQNPSATRRNLEKQWELGIDAIPCFHAGSPWAELEWCCQRPKIAVSSRMPHKAQWLTEIFRRIHPKRVHGFAMASRQAMDIVPFDSIDATSWILAPSRFGNWAGYTGKQAYLNTKGIKDFWVEVVEHQRRSDWASGRWRTALESIRGAPCTL